jgi:hypothetical protein
MPRNKHQHHGCERLLLQPWTQQYAESAQHEHMLYSIINLFALRPLQKCCCGSYESISVKCVCNTPLPAAGAEHNRQHKRSLMLPSFHSAHHMPSCCLESL